MSVKYKYHDNLCIEFYDSGCIILDASEEYYHLLNSTATFIFEKIPTHSIEDIARLLVLQYPNEVNYEHALESVSLILSNMLELNILVEIAVP